jgi:hypothetical protein
MYVSGEYRRNIKIINVHVNTIIVDKHSYVLYF